MHLPRVFDLFFSTKTDKVGLGGSLGMGIGLYHCQELMKQYGGKILVENAPEGGAAFTVRIPSGMGTTLDRVKH
jgi:signal transduction histidine kinase